MKLNIRHLGGALAIAALVSASQASAQAVSDSLVITNPTNPTSVFVGTTNIPEAFNEPLLVLFTGITTTTTLPGGLPPIVTNTINGTTTTDRLNAGAGLFILTEPGSLTASVTITVGANQTFASVLASLNITGAQISDIVGILSATSVTTPGIGGISTTVDTTTFGIVNDGDPAGLLGLVVVPGTVLRFSNEPSNAVSARVDVSAAFNTNSGGVTTAIFTSDSEAPATVPDSGMTVSLLGLGLTGLALLRRKLA